MEYTEERARLATLAQRAHLAQPGGGLSAARNVVQSLTAAGEAFEQLLAQIDRARPELAEQLPSWYTATRAIAAECVIVAEWWSEELVRETLRWTDAHDARLAEDVAHFEQLLERATDELEDPPPAAVAFASVAVPDLPPWEENLPPRAHRWGLVFWPVLAALALGIGAYGFHSWQTGQPAITTALGGSPTGTSALPAGSGSPSATAATTVSTRPAASRTTTAAVESMAPVAAETPTTAQPAPRRTTAQAQTSPTTVSAATAPGVTVTLVPADGDPQIEALITVTTTSTAATTLYVVDYGTTAAGTRTADTMNSETLSGKTSYTVAEVISTASWCGDTITVEATSGSGTAASQTPAGC